MKEIVLEVQCKSCEKWINDNIFNDRPMIDVRRSLKYAKTRVHRKVYGIYFRSYREKLQVRDKIFVVLTLRHEVFSTHQCNV